MSLSQTSLALGAKTKSQPRTGLVRTLDREAFDAACASLMQCVLEDCQPDLLIGIRTGGLVVAEAMARAAAQKPAVMSLASRRASTGTKAKLTFLPALLKQLPGPLVDSLRVVEHRLLTPRRRARGAQAQFVDPAETEAICRHLAALPPGRVAVVVDDAVDSGVTLAAVLRVLRAGAPEAEFRSAAITITAEQPLAMPDYALYRGVLCRFPWSFDAAH